MEWKAMFNENEKPLERLIEGGGFCGIFRTIGCIGDSLTSGEFDFTCENGARGGCDLFDYSWPQHIARWTGSKVYNFSRGGLTADAYINFANMNGFWWNEHEETPYVCQANIIALGVNDILQAMNNDEDLGDIGDIDLENCNNNKNTFVGSYAKIIQRLRMEQPDCRIFLMTIPKADRGEKFQKYAEKHAELIYKIADLFEYVYVMDIRKYGAVYDEEFQKKFYLGTHMNPMGYLYTAKVVASYMDYIIRHNMEDFKQIQFIGKQYTYKEIKQQEK